MKTPLWFKNLFCQHKEAIVLSAQLANSHPPTVGHGITIVYVPRTIEHLYCGDCGKEKIGEGMWRNYE